MTSNGIVTTLTNFTRAELLPLTTSQMTAITEGTQNGSKICYFNNMHHNAS